MIVVRTMSSIYQFQIQNRIAMCNGKDCLLAAHCANYVGNHPHDSAVFDNCDVEFRPGFMSIGKK